MTALELLIQVRNGDSDFEGDHEDELETDFDEAPTTLNHDTYGPRHAAQR
jgi:hypothetical protein